MVATHTPESTFHRAALEAQYQLDQATSTPRTWLDALSHAELLRGYASNMIDAAARAARADGASWTDIGEALGISRQAAHERFRYLDT